MLNRLDSLFAALARLLVAQGVSFQDLAERMKAHYVAAAIASTEGKVTDSKLSVMTGLQRRDVARLRAAPPRSERQNHLSALVARWRTDAAYDSQPLARTGPAPSFEALAQDISRDVHPRTMLNALAEAGTVALSGDTVTLCQTSYQPQAGSADQLGYLSHNLGDHIAAAAENISGQTPPHFERAVHYTALTDDQIATLREMHQNEQMALFEALSHRAADMKAQNAALKTQAQARFRAGAYFYTKDDEK